jgi:carbamoyltransferase
MLTLGVHDGHTATACLLDDGHVVSCVSEERLTREKEWIGFPRRAIQECLDLAGRGPHEVEAVGLCSLMPQIGSEGYHRPALHKRLFGQAVRILPQRLLQSPRNAELIQQASGFLFRQRRDGLLRDLAATGVLTPNVTVYEHHRLHAATTYYLSWFRQRAKNLVITLDGSGDAVCGTLSLGERGRLERRAVVFNYNSICDFYTRVTQFLGMKPMSHEYKVMGMAPYASDHGKEEIKRVFRSYFRVDPNDPLNFQNTASTWKWQFEERLTKDLKGTRFDVVAGALQEVFEEVVVQWVRNAIRVLGSGDLALSGGGFMNVKLNYLISQLPEVTSLFVMPGCGDESNPIGAAILAALDQGFPADQVKPLHDVYWGRSYTNQDAERAIQSRLANQGFQIQRHEDANQAVAEHLVEGKVVGRFTGRMEWGARSLGNRSIVADPRKQQVIHKINKAIKMRDFWMPFAPAVLIEYRERYLNLREDYPCPFMTIAPDTRPDAWDAITAGLHPFDKSARAQVLDPDHHPGFHDLVTKFERLTGVGGVLNTSFNLHGDPVVMSPDDAIYTFLNSGLDVLQLEDFLIEKPAEQAPSTPSASAETTTVQVGETTA